MTSRREPTIALVTASRARANDRDMQPLCDALRVRGARVEVPDWDDGRVDWARFDMVVLRSTWDYPRRYQSFLAWIATVERVTTLVNDGDVVRWNTDKRYLLDLARADVPVVTTWRIEPGGDFEPALDELLLSYPRYEFVVKPSIGSGAAYARRYLPGERVQAVTDHARLILDAGFPVLLQPYFRSVDTHGETTVIYFDGRYSHAVGKGPMLSAGAPLLANHPPPSITRREASAGEKAVAEAAMRVAPGQGKLLYARVDLVGDEQGRPHVLELELTEPTLFLRHDAEAATRFAECALAYHASARA